MADRQPLARSKGELARRGRRTDGIDLFEARFLESQASEAAVLALRAENYEHLLRAFGEGVAHQAINALFEKVAVFLGNDGAVDFVGPDLIEACIWSATYFGLRDRDTCNEFLDSLCEELSSTPIYTPAGVVYVWFSGGLSRNTLGCKGGLLPVITNNIFRGLPVGDGDWVPRYRADMAKVSACLADISKSRDSPAPLGDGVGGDVFVLALQTICSADSPSRVLYREALLQMVTAAGSSCSMGMMVAAFERLGLASLLDRWVVAAVLDELECAPTGVVLGVNVSAQSVQMTGWWRAVEARLQSAPLLASRFVLEITETAALMDLPAALQLTSRLRRLGCRIAIDNFGVGYASIRQILVLSPSIVKIDRLFLRQAARLEVSRQALFHLVGLARSLGAEVVIEGVESERDAVLVNEAGAHWYQGFYCGRPSLGKPLRVRTERHDAAVRTAPFLNVSSLPLSLRGVE